jgi:hypothetical protein
LDLKSRRRNYAKEMEYSFAGPIAPAVFVRKFFDEDLDAKVAQLVAAHPTWPALFREKLCKDGKPLPEDRRGPVLLRT